MEKATQSKRSAAGERPKTKPDPQNGAKIKPRTDAELEAEETREDWEGGSQPQGTRPRALR